MAAHGPEQSIEEESISCATTPVTTWLLITGIPIAAVIILTICSVYLEANGPLTVCSGWRLALPASVRWRRSSPERKAMDIIVLAVRVSDTAFSDAESEAETLNQAAVSLLAAVCTFAHEVPAAGIRFSVDSPASHAITFRSRNELLMQRMAAQARLLDMEVVLGPAIFPDAPDAPPVSFMRAVTHAPFGKLEDMLVADLTPEQRTLVQDEMLARITKFQEDIRNWSVQELEDAQHKPFPAPYLFLLGEELEAKFARFEQALRTYGVRELSEAQAVAYPASLKQLLQEELERRGAS